MKYEQSFNNRIDAWVKSEILPNGKRRIVDTKQRMPLMPFDNVRIKRNGS